MVKYDILVGRQTVGTMEERGDDRGPKVEFPVTLSPATKGVIAVLSFMIVRFAYFRSTLFLLERDVNFETEINYCLLYSTIPTGRRLCASGI